MIYKPKPIRTPAGIRLGDQIVVNGRRVLHMTQKGKQDDLLPEQLVELVVGRQVERIVYHAESKPSNSSM